MSKGKYAGFVEIRVLVHFSRALKAKFGNFETLKAPRSTLIGRRGSGVVFALGPVHDYNILKFEANPLSVSNVMARPNFLSKKFF